MDRGGRTQSWPGRKYRTDRRSEAGYYGEPEKYLEDEDWMVLERSPTLKDLLCGVWIDPDEVVATKDY